MNNTTAIPSSEDPPSSIFSSFRRYLSSISPHKTLRNLRLLILALAFGTLILDAITLSFEINVMNLDLAQKQVATQAALLFTPDLLAMTMALVLMLRDCFGCCRTRRPYHEQEYEGSPTYQEEEDIEGNQQRLWQQQEHKETALQGQDQEGVNQQRGKSRSRSSRTSRRGTARELHQDGSRSRSRGNSIDGYRPGDAIEHQHHDGGITLNNSNNNNNTHHGQIVPSQEHRSPRLAGVQVQNQQQQQQQQQQHPYNPREQPRYETSIVSHTIGTQQPNRISPSSAGLEPSAAARPEPLDLTKRASIPLSSSTTLSTPSPNPTTTTTTSSAAVTMANDNNSIHTKASTSSSTQSRNKQRRKKRHSYYYIAFRILFSCSLAVLALYWPASKRKPPLGYLPNLRESQNHHQGNESAPQDHNNIHNTSGGDTQHNSTITPTIVSRAFLSYGSSKESALTPPTSTSTSIRNIKSKRQSSSYEDDQEGNPIKDDHHFENLESAASGHYGNSGSGTETVGHIPPNLRPGGPGSGGYGSHWCSLEEAFGDNQSAVVYCQVKDVRPVMTYVWVSLILLELCAAYCAGDFSAAGTRRQKEDQLMAVDDDNYDLESRTVAVVASTENHSGMEGQESQPQWTTVGEGLAQAPEQDNQLGHSGISITVTEADAVGAGVGFSGSWDQGQTLRGRTGPQIDR
ncbi:hypothetical protein BGZ68_001071 [Mortierella alpina]|nr:hypothetical protein BGZ68_001071 [Mortierella alpina]